MPRPYSCTASATCIASSRVGTSTRPNGSLRSLPSRESLWSIGSAEGRGLAGARRGLRHEVPALEERGNGLELDWGWLLVAEGRQGGEDAGVELETGEAGFRWRHGV